MNTMNNDVASKTLVKNLLERMKTGVVSTVNKEGNPESSLVYYVIDESFNIYFTTYSNSRKYANISMHKMVAFNVSDAVDPQTVQMEGIAEEMKISGGHEILEKLNNVLSSNTAYFPPIAHIEKDKTVVIKIAPTMIRLGNFSFVPIEEIKQEPFHTIIG